MKTITANPGGLFRDIDALAGTEAFNLYGENGKRLGRWEACDGITDDEFLGALEALLARKDVRRPQLQLVRPKGRTA